MSEKIGCIQHDCAECKARLAQPQLQWVELPIDEFLSVFAENDASEVSDCRNSRSAQRTWVGLTDEDIENCMCMSIQKTCRAIEAKLKEKNT